MDDDCAIGILFKDRTDLGLTLRRFFGSLLIFPIGRLTTIAVSNGGHPSVQNNQLCVTNHEPAFGGFCLA
jgi:hypothetical protein